MECSMGMGVRGGGFMGVLGGRESLGDGCSGGMGVPGGWVFQGDEYSRGMSVLGDGCLGGWEFRNSNPCRPRSLATACCH